ncbi:helix-turn-helix transcriptional regulator [Carnobacterium maltaromaticum]|uniref:helix-turn-helix domain-containing protein n=1 Tax=Carnobacterium maltaromaticum TaxID=2751 RepID=UPI00295E7C79|nr:helix-turn-helix transcriptional regulator [Carnobacterium maltaromaticum]
MENNSFESACKHLGETLLDTRKSLGLSQKKLADGICSQSMISSIENGEYVPNAILLAQICKKLNISIDNTLLMNYMEINRLDEFNKNVKTLCNEHQYEELLDFMNESNILESIYRNEDYQVYYYYYGCAMYQVSNDINLAKRYLQMALDYTYLSKAKNKYVTPTEILLFGCLGVINIDLRKTDLSLSYFQNGYDYIENNKVTCLDENMLSFFYQYGFSLMKIGKIVEAEVIISKGISFAKDMKSHYMLSNLFFLLYKCYQHLKDNLKADEAFTSFKVMNKVFNDQIYLDHNDFSTDI